MSGGPAPPNLSSSSSCMDAKHVTPNVDGNVKGLEKKEEEWSGIFINPKESPSAILLVDASGSVRQQFGSPNQSGSGGKTVLEECCRLAKSLPHRNFKVLYWNSPQMDEGFKKGVLKLPFVMTADKLDSSFSFASSKIEGHCLTFPNIGFENIDDWLTENFSRTVYLLTDGQIGYADITPSDLTKLKSDVAKSITKMVARFPDVQIHIIAVENKETDYGAVENLGAAAGCDLFGVAQEHKLTKSIASFTSYTPKQPKGFSHILRVQAPPGSVPFRSSYVSERHLHKFISFIRTQVFQFKTKEDELLKLIQDLSVTASALVKDKPKDRSTVLINLFCDAFDGSQLDPVLTRFILTNAITDESAGNAALFASYRAQLKNLYKSADVLLKKDVRAAVGVSERFISVPINGWMVSCPAELVTNAMLIKGRSYPNAALSLSGDEKKGPKNETLIPMLPFRASLFDAKSNEASMSEQSLRQWTRSVVGQLYQVDQMSDLIIYHVLALNYQVSMEKSLPTTIKMFFRNLGLLMLRKKRASAKSADSTDLKHLQEGNLPLPANGDIEYFKRGMRQICTVIGLPTSLQPFTIWHLLCRALGDDDLTRVQLRHCLEDIALDAKVEPKCHPLQHHPIPNGCALDPTCLITLEDLSKTGGFRFMAHGGCCPRNMLSESALKQLLLKPETALCPVCYSSLDQKSFAPVAADQLMDNRPPAMMAALGAMEHLTKPYFGSAGSSGSDTFSFNDAKHGSINVISLSDAKHGSTNVISSSDPTATAAQGIGAMQINEAKGDILLFMRGTVGCGKSTESLRIKLLAQSKGYTVFVANVDRHACVDNNGSAAAKKVCAELWYFMRDDTKVGKRLVIVDTCGESIDAKKVFGQDLSSWKMVTQFPNYEKGKTNLSSYLDWSFYNVLCRPASSPGCDFWLNAVGAGVETCRSVHMKKAVAVFGKKAIGKWKSPPQGARIDLINALQPAAQAFAKTLTLFDIGFL